MPVGGEKQPAVGASCGIANIPPAYYSLLGSNAKVKNEFGTIVGAANIPNTGVVKARAHPDEFFDKDCLFEGKADLQGPANLYELDLGSGFDTTTLSRGDLEKAGWRFEIAAG